MESENLLYNNQYGFRRGRTTSQAILDVFKHMYEEWNNRLYIGCIFVEFSKAFETINTSNNCKWICI